ncbi:MAG: sugar-binding transcriptional regulator [Natronospirillum sp.]|uniref:sugar-binding transcriptional regulator n=1 Tax=Natronospirillum sp. TaxID=2812955 RepID=UPI0025D34693|nr:sugar-binding transcriptional regulator [Natronospirillum sp.]MCH8551891.1 sugar-binding transcriptional regulator [Natronospirillum sp.]
MSRAKAHRLIAAAMKAGYVRVSVEGEVANCIRYEEQLRGQHELTYCDVVPDLAESAMPLKALGYGGARFLQQQFESREALMIGIGHGRSLMAAVNELPLVDTGDIQFMSLLGGLTRRFTANPHDVIHRLAELTGAEAYVLPVPFLANSVEDKAVLLAQHGVAEVFDLMSSMNVALVGIGSVDREAQLVTSRMLKDEELQGVRDAGASGELLGHFFDDQGKPVESPFTERIIAPSLDSLRQHNIVALAGGPEKVDAIRAVLNSGVLSGLITDEHTATKLVMR